MTYIDKFSHKWYYTLIKKNGDKYLFGDVSRKSIIENSKFLIQYVGKDHKDKSEYLFTVFDNYEEFYKYQLNHKIENRCFFETILGERPQKIYFDVDIEIKDNIFINHEDVKSDLIKSILLTMQEFSVNLDIDKDIIVCTSHSDKKKSYHVIIDNYKVPDNSYNNTICKLVMQKMQLINLQYIDNNIYTSIRQFRLLGSQKKNTGRIKIFNNTWLFYNDIIKYKYPEILNADIYLYQFSRTLINNVSYCKDLYFIDLNKFVLQNSRLFAGSNTKKNGLEITNEIGHLALKKLAEYAQISIYDPIFPYKLGNITNGYICLKRLRSSLCKICNSVHDTEHPYMSISFKGDIYFDCRRSRNHGDGTHKTLLIGNIGSEVMSKIIVHTENTNTNIDDEDIEYEEIKFDNDEIISSIPEVIAPIVENVTDKTEIDLKTLEKQKRLARASEGGKRSKNSINYKHEFDVVSNIDKISELYKGK